MNNDLSNSHSEPTMQINELTFLAYNAVQPSYVEYPSSPAANPASTVPPAPYQQPIYAPPPPTYPSPYQQTSAPKPKISKIALLIALIIGIILGSVITYVGVEGKQSSSVASATTSHYPFSSDLLINDPLNGTYNFWSVNGHCLYMNNAYHINLADAGKFYYCTENTIFDNFSFEATIKSHDGYGLGLVFRADPLVGNYYFFDVYNDGYYAFYRYKNHEISSKLARGYVTPQGNIPETFTLSVVAHNNSFWLYMNKKLLATVTDTSTQVIHDGKLGLAVNNYLDKGESSVDFINAKVWALSFIFYDSRISTEGTNNKVGKKSACEFPSEILRTRKRGSIKDRRHALPSPRRHVKPPIDRLPYAD
jgi:hypothetical protein